MLGVLGAAGGGGGPPPPPPRLPHPGSRRAPEPQRDDGQQRSHRGSRDGPRQPGLPAGRSLGSGGHGRAALVTESGGRGERGAARMADHGSRNLTGTNPQGSVVYSP